MTGLEFSLCVSAVTSSSLSQLFIKAASVDTAWGRRLMLLGCGAALQLGAIILAVLALRTMTLSQLVAFAAFAYVMVPLGSHLVFGERLWAGFFIGSALIVLGIVVAAS